MELGRAGCCDSGPPLLVPAQNPCPCPSATSGPSSACSLEPGEVRARGVPPSEPLSLSRGPGAPHPPDLAPLQVSLHQVSECRSPFVLSERANFWMISWELLGVQGTKSDPATPMRPVQTHCDLYTHVCTHPWAPQSPESCGQEEPWGLARTHPPTFTE